MRKALPLSRLFAAGLLVLAAGCASTGSSAGGSMTDDVDFDDANGKRCYEIEPDDRGYEVTDGDKKEIVDFRRETEGAMAGALRIAANDQVLGHVVHRDGGLAIVEKGKDAPSWQLTVGADGDVRITSPQGPLYTLERRSDGYKILDANGELAGRIEGDDKFVVTDAKGRTYLKCKARTSALSAACIGLQSIAIEYRLALLVGVAEYRVGG